MDAAIFNEIERRNHHAAMAWHTATIGRMKKIPKLQTLLIEHDGKTKSKQPEAWQVSYAKMNVWAMQMQSKRKH